MDFEKIEMNKPIYVGMTSFHETSTNLKREATKTSQVTRHPDSPSINENILNSWIL